MTKIAKFEIVTCLGNHVDYVEIDILDEDVDNIRNEDNDWDESDLKYEYTGEALSAGNVTNYVCDSCYDNAYRVEFVEWVENTGEIFEICMDESYGTSRGSQLSPTFLG